MTGEERRTAIQEALLRHGLLLHRARKALAPDLPVQDLPHYVLRTPGPYWLLRQPSGRVVHVHDSGMCRCADLHGGAWCYDAQVRGTAYRLYTCCHAAYQDRWPAVVMALQEVSGYRVRRGLGFGKEELGVTPYEAHQIAKRQGIAWPEPCLSSQRTAYYLEREVLHLLAQLSGGNPRCQVCGRHFLAWGDWEKARWVRTRTWRGNRTRPRCHSYCRPGRPAAVFEEQEKERLWLERARTGLMRVRAQLRARRREASPSPPTGS